MADIYHVQNKNDEAINLLKDSINFSGMNEKNEALYKKVIQIYTAQNQIAEAYDFLNGVDNYIRQRLSSNRPSALSISPGQGSFDSEITVKIDVPDGCIVYYTLDNTLPTKNSSIYVPNETAIKIDKGAMTLRAFAINEIGLLSDETVLRYTVYNDNTKYDFKDDKMEAIIRANLKKSTGTVLYKDLATLSKLTDKLSSISSSSKIKSLEDLSAMTNLKELSLDGETSIGDFAILQTMTSLTSLSLTNCNISNSVANTVFTLKNITDLNLSGNGISDISKIVSLGGLTSLDVSNNLITDLSTLSGVSSLTTLKAANNKITSLSSLSSNTALTELDVSSNSQMLTLTGICLLYTSRCV